MLEFENGEENVKIKFRHILPEEWQDQKDAYKGNWFKYKVGITGDKVQGITICTIELNENGNPIQATIGIGACSKSESNFSKKRGRKVALADALKIYDKDFRTTVWEKYLEVSG